MRGCWVQALEQEEEKMHQQTMAAAREAAETAKRRYRQNRQAKSLPMHMQVLLRGETSISENVRGGTPCQHPLYLDSSPL